MNGSKRQALGGMHGSLRRYAVTKEALGETELGSRHAGAEYIPLPGGGEMLLVEAHGVFPRELFGQEKPGSAKQTVLSQEDYFARLARKAYESRSGKGRVDLAELERHCKDRAR